MTQKTKEDISATLVGLAFVTHIFSYFFWQYIRVINIYYATIYFNMFVDGFVFMMLMRGKIWKVVSTLMFWGGSHLLYMELSRNPMNWTDLDLVVFGIAGINSIMISNFFDNVKYKKRHG